MKADIKSKVSNYIDSLINVKTIEKGKFLGLDCNRNPHYELTFTNKQFENLLNHVAETIFKIVEENSQYYVMLHNGDKPTFKHPDYQSAYKEAERLCNIKPNEKGNVAEILMIYDDVAEMPF